jgi:hypothetical protein
MDLFKTTIARRSEKSTSHARKFYFILSGETVTPDTSKGYIDERIKEYSQADIDAARIRYKNQRLASPYKRAMCKELGRQDYATITRKQADTFLRVERGSTRFNAAKAKLRGFTYGNK